jgi:hypothetical protein
MKRHSAGPEPPRLTWGKLTTLLTLQAGFSDAHLQRDGYLHWIWGEIRRPPSEPARQEAQLLEADMLRQGALNTQPVMAAALLGALDRVLCSAASQSLPRSPRRLLEIGGAVLAQWGDQILWGAGRPAFFLLGLALLPWAPLAVILGILALGLLLHLGGRVLFYAWGWRRGWGVVDGGGRWWHRAPGLIMASHGPLVLGAAVSLALAAFRAGAWGERPFFLAGLWFILGVPLGRWVGQRPGVWGWICWAAMVILAAMLEGWPGLSP